MNAESDHRYGPAPMITLGALFYFLEGSAWMGLRPSFLIVHFSGVEGFFNRSYGMAACVAMYLTRTGKPARLAIHTRLIIDVDHLVCSFQGHVLWDPSCLVAFSLFHGGWNLTTACSPRPRFLHLLELPVSPTWAFLVYGSPLSVSTNSQRISIRPRRILKSACCTTPTSHEVRAARSQSVPPVPLRSPIHTYDALTTSTPTSTITHHGARPQARSGSLMSVLMRHLPTCLSLSFSTYPISSISLANAAGSKSKSNEEARERK